MQLVIIRLKHSLAMPHAMFCLKYPKFMLIRMTLAQVYLRGRRQKHFFNIKTRMRISPIPTTHKKTRREFLALNLRLRDETKKNFLEYRLRQFSRESTRIRIVACKRTYIFQRKGLLISNFFLKLHNFLHLKFKNLNGNLIFQDENENLFLSCLEKSNVVVTN